MSRKVDRLMTGMPKAFSCGDGQSVKSFACLCMEPVLSTRGDIVLFKQISLKLMKGQTGSPVLAHKEWSSRSSLLCSSGRNVLPVLDQVRLTAARLEYGQDLEDISSGAGVPALFHANPFACPGLKNTRTKIWISGATDAQVNLIILPHCQ